MRVALIPVKELAQAKMRLAPALDAAGRTSLAIAMLSDVITACRESAMFDEIRVLSRDRDIAWHARDLGALPLPEPATLDGLNDSLTFGQRYAGRRLAARELLVLPADVPLARAIDIRSVIDALGETPRSVALVRARDGGTNALAIRPPEAIPMRFGRDSASAHIAAARAAGIDAAAVANDALAFDVDSIDDVDALPALPCGPETAAWVAARAVLPRERRA